MKTITYIPQGGVCSKQMDVTVEEGVISIVRITGGCAGNSQGVSRLVEGMTPNEAISKLRGIECKGKGTSCPDQLSKALSQFV